MSPSTCSAPADIGREEFHSLPMHLHIGYLPINFVEPCPLVNATRCVTCNRAGPSYYICHFGHVTCPFCAKNTNTETTLTCGRCRTFTPLVNSGIPVEVFEHLELQCVCGIRGNLATLHSHYLVIKGNEDIDARHEELRKSRRVEEKPHRYPTISIWSKWAANDVLDGLYKDMAGRIPVKPQTRQDSPIMGTGNFGERHPDQASEIPTQSGVINDGSNDTPDNTNADNVVSNIAEAKADELESERPAPAQSGESAEPIKSATEVVHFSFTHIYERYLILQTIEFSPNVMKTIHGVDFSMKVALRKMNGNTYLGFFTKPTIDPLSSLKYPLRRRIVYTIHDRNGSPLHSRGFDTFRNGEFVAGFDNGEKAGSIGWFDFIPIDSVFRDCVRSDGQIQFSIHVTAIPTQ